jgi:hypothetical protein
VTMDRADVLRAGDLNLVEVLRHFARSQPAGVVHEEAGIVCFAGSPVWPGPFDNGAFVLAARVEPREAVERATRFFDGLRPGYCIWSAEHHDPGVARAAEAAGLVSMGEGPPQMVLDHGLPDAVAREGVQLRPVVDDETRRDYLAVLADSFTTTQGTPAEVLEGNFGHVDALHGPNVRAVVASLDGEPAAGAFVLVSHGVAGVQYVGTVERARGRGLGELVTRWVSNAGFDLGARIAALQASEMGEPVYRRMGYQTVSRYSFWMGPAPH